MSAATTCCSSAASISEPRSGSPRTSRVAPLQPCSPRLRCVSLEPAAACRCCTRLGADRPLGSPTARRRRRKRPCDHGPVPATQEFTTRDVRFVRHSRAGELRPVLRVHSATRARRGRGGAALMVGAGRRRPLTVADINVFEISDSQSTLFAFQRHGRPAEGEGSSEGMRRIDPELEIEGARPRMARREMRADHAARSCLVKLGTDDLAASLLIYRTARTRGLPVMERLCARRSLGLRHPPATRCRRSGSAVRPSADGGHDERGPRGSVPMRGYARAWCIPRRAITSTLRWPPRSRRAARPHVVCPDGRARPAC